MKTVAFALQSHWPSHVLDRLYTGTDESSTSVVVLYRSMDSRMCWATFECSLYLRLPSTSDQQARGLARVTSAHTLVAAAAARRCVRRFHHHRAAYPAAVFHIAM